jgi:hypothetical protein
VAPDLIGGKAEGEFQVVKKVEFLDSFMNERRNTEEPKDPNCLYIAWRQQ